MSRAIKSLPFAIWNYVLQAQHIPVLQPWELLLGETRMRRGERVTLAALELEGAPDRAGLGQQSSKAGKELWEGSSCLRGTGGDLGEGGLLGRRLWAGGTLGPCAGTRALGMALGPLEQHWDPWNGTGIFKKLLGPSGRH